MLRMKKSRQNPVNLDGMTKKGEYYGTSPLTENAVGVYCEDAMGG